MAQPAAPFVPRDLIRAVPFSTPHIFVGVLAAAGSENFGWDVALAMSDRNALGYGNSSPQSLATGFFFDLSLFSDQASTLDVLLLASDNVLAVPRSVMAGAVPLVVPASTLTLVAGLRAVGNFIQYNVVNTAGVDANVEIFAAVRSA